MTDALLTWLLSYALHSSVLLLSMLALERGGALRHLSPRAAERLWRLALFAGLLSASLATGRPLLPNAEHAVESGRAVAVAMPSPSVVQTPPSRVIRAAADAAKPADQAPSAFWTQATLALAALWLAGAALALLALAAQWLWLRLEVARLADVAEPRWQALLQSEATRQGLHAPPLRLARRWHSPLLAPGGVLCLPPWCLTLGDAQARAVLGHELAHLRRRDPAWRLAGALLTALLWPQLLNRIALRRLDLLAELACDAAAAPAPAERQALAASLLRCAQALRGTARAPALACTIEGGGSALAQRVRSLLAGPGDEAASPTRRARRAAVLGGLFGAALTALVAVPVIAVRDADAQGFLAQLWPAAWVGDLFEHGPGTRIHSSWPGGELTLRVDGKISFNAAEDDVQSLVGTLSLRERNAGLSREMRLAAKPDGTIERSYRESGQPAEFGPEARQWWGQMVARIAADLTPPEQRARALFERGGIEAVLADAEKPLEDFPRRRRIEAAMQLKPVAAALDRLIAVATRIGGDFERREALHSLLRGSVALAAPQQIAVLKAIAGMDSDFEQREALAALAPQLSREADVLAAWGTALAHIGGDFELRGAIEQQLRQAGPSDAALLQVALTAVGRLQGDFERREALSAVARQMRGDEAELVAAYARAAAAIPGAFERREALMGLLGREHLQRAGLADVLAALNGIDGFERLQVLKRVTERLPAAGAADADFIAQLRRSAQPLSEFERGQLEKLLDGLDQRG